MELVDQDWEGVGYLTCYHFTVSTPNKKEDVIKKKLGSYSVNRANDITSVQETRPSIASEKGETRQMAVLLRLSRVLSNRRGVATIDR